MHKLDYDINQVGWSFDNSYSKLSDDFYIKQKPVPVNSPDILILNKNLSKDLNLDFSNVSNEDLSQIF